MDASLTGSPHSCNGSGVDDDDTATAWLNGVPITVRHANAEVARKVRQCHAVLGWTKGQKATSGAGTPGSGCRGYHSSRASCRADQEGRSGKVSAQGDVPTKEQEDEHDALVAWRRLSPAAGVAAKAGDKEGCAREIKMERLGKGADDGRWLDEDRGKGRSRSVGADRGGEKGTGRAAGRGERFRDRHPGEWDVAYSACAGRAEEAGRWKDMEEDGVVIVLTHAKGWRPTERGRNKHYGDCDSPMGCACCRSDNNEAQGFCPVCDVAGKPQVPGP